MEFLLGTSPRSLLAPRVEFQISPYGYHARTYVRANQTARISLLVELGPRETHDGMAVRVPDLTVYGSLRFATAV